MSRKLYKKPKRVGWILFLLGLIGLVSSIMLFNLTNSTNFFALSMFSVLFIIAGLTTVGVYRAMESRANKSYESAAPLLRYFITAGEYSAYAEAEAKEIWAINKQTLMIQLVFCALVAIIGPIIVKESKIVPFLTGLGLAALLSVAFLLITAYRVRKLKTGEQEVVLTTNDAIVGNQFFSWTIPSTILTDVKYYNVGEYESSPLALIKITFMQITTPQVVLIPVPAVMEEKAKEAAEILRGLCVFQK